MEFIASYLFILLLEISSNFEAFLRGYLNEGYQVERIYEFSLPKEKPLTDYFSIRHLIDSHF